MTVFSFLVTKMAQLHLIARMHFLLHVLNVLKLVILHQKEEGILVLISAIQTILQVGLIFQEKLDRVAVIVKILSMQAILVLVAVSPALNVQVLNAMLR
jgi:hypothetical protein